MKITIKPNGELTNIWMVEAHGLCGGVAIDSREKIYSGPDAQRAKATYFEALILARAIPPGIDIYSDEGYSAMVYPLFAEDEPTTQETPFAWAVEGWSSDPVFDGQEPQLLGADLFWIDEHGAKLPAEAELDADEAALLRSTPRHRSGAPYPIESIAAAIAALALRSETADPKRSVPARNL